MSYEATCPDCRTTYRAGERGGHCMACHQTFASDGLADRHRVGPMAARRCLFPAEMTVKGWRLDARGVWRGPAPVDPSWRRQEGVVAS